MNPSMGMERITASQSDHMEKSLNLSMSMERNTESQTGHVENR